MRPPEWSEALARKTPKTPPRGVRIVRKFRYIEATNAGATATSTDTNPKRQRIPGVIPLLTLRVGMVLQ
jgi:hypothetical protein